MLPTPLVSVDWLAPRLHEVRVLDARGGPDAREAYTRAHVEGAYFADLERDLSAPDDPARGGRHPLPPIEAFRATLGRWGIGSSTPVVVYDSSGGALAAARAWWMLRAVGHQAVAVLDGAWDALPTTDIVPELVDGPAYPLLTRDWSLPTVDADEVDQRRIDPTWRVVDVRASARFEGRVEPLDPVAGHIAGATNLPCTENLEEGRFLDAATLRARFERLGVPPARIIVSCGSGVTACHTLLALEHAGLRGASLYVGSWSEWCRSHRERGPSEAPTR